MPTGWQLRFGGGIVSKYEQDLDPTGGFDYIEGPSNDVDTFEGMHKNLYKEDEYEDTDNEDDGFVDIEKANSITCSGLDSYHKTIQLDRLSYAKPNLEITSIIN